MYTLNNFYLFILEAIGRDLEGSTDLVMGKGNHNPLAAVHKAFPLASNHTATKLEEASFRHSPFPYPFELGRIPKEFAIRAINCSSASTNHSSKCLLTSYSHQFATKA